MAVIDAHGAHEIARVACYRYMTSKGIELETNRLFVMTSDGRILTRALDGPINIRNPYRIAERHIPDSARTEAGLLTYVRAMGYQVES